MSLVLLLIVAVTAYSVYTLLRPLPAPVSRLIPPVLPAQVKVNLPWPSAGQSAFGAVGYGMLESHNLQKPSPTASVAKTITALAILEKKPLKSGEQGPAIPITAKDVALYNAYASKDGSVVPVLEGSTITEYQALQAMMLPSANNVSDTAAIWAFGSLEAYRAYASDMVKRMDMTSTTIGSDASGFSPSTTSTASDLVRLGIAALNNPVLAEIVGQKQAIFPNYGTIENVNNFLGTNGIRGIKTGNTDEAGGCFLVAADVNVAGKPITVVAAVMGATTRGQAMRDTVPLIQSTVSLFHTTHVVRAGQNVGQITTPWGASSDLTASQPISVLAWNGTALSPTVRQAGQIPLPAPSHTAAGTLELRYQDKTLTSNVYTVQALDKPTAIWRLTHPF